MVGSSRTGNGMAPPSTLSPPPQAVWSVCGVSMRRVRRRWRSVRGNSPNLLGLAPTRGQHIPTIVWLHDLSDATCPQLSLAGGAAGAASVGVVWAESPQPAGPPTTTGAMPLLRDRSRRLVWAGERLPVVVGRVDVTRPDGSDSSVGWRCGRQPHGLATRDGLRTHHEPCRAGVKPPR